MKLIPTLAPAPAIAAMLDEAAELAAAYEVDEVKAIHDRAAMLQAAARVANNVDAETRAYEIRMRAARKAGELSKKIEKATGNQYGKSDCRTKHDVLSDAGG